MRLQQPSLGARLRSLACLAASSAPALVQVSANLAASGLVSHLVNASGTALMNTRQDKTRITPVPDTRGWNWGV